jgi:hypothetical protein
METYDGPAWRLVTEDRKLTMQAGQGVRRSGIQVDRLYSRPSPAYNAGRAWCGWMSWWLWRNVYVAYSGGVVRGGEGVGGGVLCFWCRHQTRISRGGLKRGRSAFYYSVCSVCMTSFLSPSLLYSIIEYEEILLLLLLLQCELACP